jgi:tRNA(fMet)-specific endonuclease VapC
MTKHSSSLLDTDILSAVMRKNPLATERARSYLTDHRRFTFSIITRYEVLRGLLAKGAEKQLAAFDKLCAKSRVLDITDSIIVRASEIYADLHKKGKLIGDADILIAATALTHGLAVVTNNEVHLGRVQNLQIVNWLAPKCFEGTSSTR